MLVHLSDWSGRVRGHRTDDFDDLRVTAIVSPPDWSFTSPFRVIGSDRCGYFVKTIDACVSNARASLAIEYIVAGAGRLIGAPVCESSLIRIPEELDGYTMPPLTLSAGLAHASLALERADERGRPSLTARGHDDNRRRHVGIYALYDWCYGSDQQWLYDLDQDLSIYSHDHGLYLPPNTGHWTQADLEQFCNDRRELPDARDGLDPEAVEDTASALEKIDGEALANLCAACQHRGQ
ncbi:hypothetical protein ABZ897_31560 [Nonomuraea sp. NPDC046802]|uniref:hypothetical protein n=1 Tax=Nonomuraea sp. NPDC046802 TaxID=3154919 RepID=UPI0033FE7C8F